MAEMQQPRERGATEQSGRLTTAMNLLGAVTSLALLVGIGVWGYKMVMRDVSGVPVIKAAAGPMRVQPEDPGGRQALNQGLSVNEIAAGGAAGEPAERLILAPEPLDLTVDAAAFAAADAPDGEDAAAMAAGNTDDSEAGRGKAMRGMADDIAWGVPALDALESEPGAAEPEPAEEVAAAEADTVKGGLGRSLRPRLRPAALTDGSEAVTRAAAQVGAVRDVDPATIPAGTRLAQLGAFASREVALEQWARLAERFDGYLADKARVIQKASSGGRTFYRLRAMGFDDLAHARRFCSALVDQNADCIPVVIR